MLANYLRRIGFPQQQPAPAPTLDTLTAIHRCHALSIPFENLLFVHHTMKGDARHVDVPSLHHRIVDRRRGEMCQGQNTLLRHHLAQLGELSGRALHSNGTVCCGGP